MFFTSGYRGHFVHVSVTASGGGRERIDAQIIHPDGRFDLVPIAGISFVCRSSMVAASGSKRRCISRPAISNS
jgi:hypothetical protein